MRYFLLSRLGQVPHMSQHITQGPLRHRNPKIRADTAIYGRHILGTVAVRRQTTPYEKTAPEHQLLQHVGYMIV